MDIHVDHKDRETAFHGQPTMPDTLLSRTQIQAVDFLERCASEREPLAALTGAAGTGKTVALNTALARRESAGDRVIRVNNFVAGPLSLHRVLASSLGVAQAADLSAEELEPVLRRALADAGQAEPPVVAVDDAQSLLPETLRYLCLLAGLRDGGRPLFRILLVGRPGFTVRQPIPLQFTLESMRPEASREVVEHGLAAAGVTAIDEVVQNLVQQGQGNLRKLGVLLRESIGQAQQSGVTPGSRRRVTTQSVQVAAGARPARRQSSRRSGLGPLLALPAVLVVGVAAAGVAYHEGWFGSPATAPEEKSVAQVAAAAPAPAPVLPPLAPVRNLPSQPVAAPASPPPPSGTAAPSAPTPAPDATPTGLAQDGQPAAPGPDQVPPTASPAVVPPPSQPARTAASSQPSAPPPDAGPPDSGGAQSTAPARIVAGQRGHFRIYNIGACHRGVCPRWSVTDLDRQQRFVAAFDLASLHLDRETMQRVREGSLDLIVSGAVVRRGTEAAALDAAALQSVAPHRGRPRVAESPEDLSDPSSPVPPTQSPPPGFLSLPPDIPPGAQPAASPYQPGNSPYQQGGQY